MFKFLTFFRIVVELDKINSDLQDLLNEVQELCQEVAPESSVAAMLAPSHLRERCRQEASEMVAKNHMINDNAPTKMNQLVTELTALMLQVKVSFTTQNIIKRIIMEFKICSVYRTLIVTHMS